MKTYYYKGFKIYKVRDTYFVANERDGQIAPNDSVQPRTIKECKEAINNWLK